MNLVLHDNNLHLRFAPLTLSRPVAELRMGIFTNTERWQKWIPEAQITFETEKYFSKKFPSNSNKSAVSVNAQIHPNDDVVATLLALEENQSVYHNETWLFSKGNGKEKIQFKGQEPLIIENRWELFQKNDEAIVADFFVAIDGKDSSFVSRTNTIIGNPEFIFIEEGAIVEACTLNTSYGPIYIGKNAEVMEGSMLRGPFVLCENASVKMGSKIYGATTIGPECKVGGEISNCVFQAYSNKGHDGFLGNSVIGEWCNFGADSNTSNLKNNYSNVRTYNYETQNEEQTDVQFMGVFMGDHSKTGINTMLNTASVIGFSSNIFGGDFPPKMVPDFSWGGANGFVSFDLDKAKEVAKAMMERRKIEFSLGDEEIFNHLFKK